MLCAIVDAILNKVKNTFYTKLGYYHSYFIETNPSPLVMNKLTLTSL